MSKLLKRLFGKEWFCRMFHTSYGTSDNKWYCKKCDIIMDKRLNDNFFGPR